MTVEASPQQVARLAQAQATGRLMLSLVGKTDKTVADAAPVDTGNLIGDTAQAAQPQDTPPCVVRTRRGAELGESVPCLN